MESSSEQERGEEAAEDRGEGAGEEGKQGEDGRVCWLSAGYGGSDC